MAKETKEKVYNTPFHEKVIAMLKENGYENIEEDKVAISVDNKSSYGTIYYNFSSTRLHVDKSEADAQTVRDSGFKYWSTWHWGVDY